MIVSCPHPSIHQNKICHSNYDISFFQLQYISIIKYFVGLNSAVDTTTRYELDDSGIESLWGQVFRPRPDRPWGQPNLLYKGYRVFPWGKAVGVWC